METKNTLQVIFRSLHTRQSDIHPFSPETILCRFDPIRRASRGHRRVREETSSRNIVDSETHQVDFVVDACPWHSIPHRIPPRSGKPLSTGSSPFQRAAPPSDRHGTGPSGPHRKSDTSRISTSAPDRITVRAAYMPEPAATAITDAAGDKVPGRPPTQVICSLQSELSKNPRTAPGQVSPVFRPSCRHWSAVRRNRPDGSSPARPSCVRWRFRAARGRQPG